MIISEPLEFILDSLVLFYFFAFYNQLQGYSFHHHLMQHFLYTLILGGVMGMVFDDLSYMLIIIGFIFIEMIRQKRLTKFNKLRINFFLLSSMIEIILLITSSALEKAIFKILPRFGNPHSFPTNNDWKAITAIVINFLVFLVVWKFFKKNQRVIDDLKQRISDFGLGNQIFWMLGSLFFFFEIILFIGDLEEITNSISGTITVTFVAFAIFMGWQVVNLIQIFSERQKVLNDLERNRQMNAYLTNIQEQYDDLRRFKHDFKNIVLSMGMKDGQPSRQYEKLYDDLLKQDEFTADLDGQIVTEYRKVNNEPLRGLIIQKFFKAKSQGVKMIVEITDKEVELKNDVLDVVRVMGILLDHAIEETLQGDDRDIDLALIQTDDTLEISLENPLNHDLKVQDIFKCGLSLANVKDIVERNPNLYLDTEIIEHKLRIR